MHDMMRERGRAKQEEFEQNYKGPNLDQTRGESDQAGTFEGGKIRNIEDATKTDYNPNQGSSNKAK